MSPLFSLQDYSSCFSVKMDSAEACSEVVVETEVCCEVVGV